MLKFKSLFFLLILMNIVWAGSYVAVKLGLKGLTPLSLIFWRMGIATVVLFIWAAVKGLRWHIDFKSFLRIVTLGCIIAASHLLWVYGLSYTTASSAAVLYAFEPIWAIILVTIIFREKFHLGMGAGLILAFVGIVILSDISPSNFNPLFAAASCAFGNFLVVASLLCESMFSIIVRPLVTRYHPIVIIAYALLVTEVIVAAAVFLSGSFSFPSTARDTIAVLYLSLPCTVVGYVFWVKLMRHLPINVMFYTILIQPITGPIIAFVTIGEIIRPELYSGGAFILLGVVLATFSYLRSHPELSFEINPQIS